MTENTPQSSAADRIPEIALDWHRAGRGVALATVIETWGSAPRPVGCQLVIDAAGAIEGSVSGGCVEGAVIIEAQAAIQAGEQRVLTYGVTDENAFEVGLACGGTIRILVEPVGSAMPEAMLSALVQARAAKTPIGYGVNIQTGARRLLEHAEAADRFSADKSGFDGEEFITIHNPPLRMAVIGAVHIAQALVPMARIAGFDVTLIDPRPVFGSDARFPGVTVIDDWPDEALSAFAPDSRSAIVTLTHDAKLDDPALLSALGSEAFYIGSLGSPRTHGKRVERLKAKGFPDTQISRIHGPVGLDIGAKSPAEIAVSILAEVVARLRKG